MSGLNLPPVLITPDAPRPPQMTISFVVHTAVCDFRGSGALVVLVAVQLSVMGSYLPPLLKWVPPPFQPPQMIISLPVHTAVWKVRASGAFTVVVGDQLFVFGLYLPPLFKTEPMKSTPPHT